MKILADLFVNVIRKHNGTIKFINIDGSITKLSYNDLYEQSKKTAAALSEIGINPGQKLIFQCDNNILFLKAFWACQLIGAIPVVFPSVTAYDPKSKESKTFYDTLHTVETCDNILLDKAAFSKIKLINLEQRFICLDDLNETQALETIHQSSATSKDPALLLFTSGTSGKSKGVIITHRNIISSAKAKIQALNMQKSETTFSWVSSSISAGLVDFHLRDCILGCDQVFAQVSYIVDQPLRWLDIVDNNKITISFAPNYAFPMIANAVTNSVGKSWDLSSLKHLIIGGELVLESTVNILATSLKSFKFSVSAITPGFGMTETCAGCIFSDSLIFVSEGSVSFACLGHPVPTLDIRFVDANNNPVKPGCMGRFQIKGPIITPGYVNNPQANHKSFTQDGWFITGDRGYYTSDGVFIYGRDKETTIVQGASVDLTIIESILHSATDSKICVFLLPAAVKHDKQLVVLASKQKRYTPHEICKLIQDLLTSKFAISADILLTLDDSDFQQSELGKIKRESMKQCYLAGDFGGEEEVNFR